VSLPADIKDIITKNIEFQRIAQLDSPNLLDVDVSSNDDTETPLVRAIRYLNLIGISPSRIKISISEIIYPDTSSFSDIVFDILHKIIGRETNMPIEEDLPNLDSDLRSDDTMLDYNSDLLGTHRRFSGRGNRFDFFVIGKNNQVIDDSEDDNPFHFQYANINYEGQT